MSTKKDKFNFGKGLVNKTSVEFVEEQSTEFKDQKQEETPKKQTKPVLADGEHRNTKTHLYMKASEMRLLTKIGMLETEGSLKPFKMSEYIREKMVLPYLAKKKKEFNID